ncbi:twin-arginine translocase TatA/TatE family subunit [Desulfosarcina sp.]|uniref:twin-arginine translocase TatA/TatE family subunit n=1 Tax=Desulfosarcina sp. TaxID=2027861 RepID=UPI003970FD6A
MFGIGMPEMILILAVALIVIGPKKLPDLAKSLGKAMGEFKKATSDLKESMQIDTELKAVKTAFNDINREGKKEGSPFVGEGGEKPVDAAAPGAASDPGNPANADPMDTLKAAFHRPSEETADDGSPSAKPASDTGPDRDSEPRKG